MGAVKPLLFFVGLGAVILAGRGLKPLVPALRLLLNPVGLLLVGALFVLFLLRRGTVARQRR